MFGNHFYWASLRKINAVFGNLFNNIRVQRVDADSNAVKIFTVPIEQAQKEGYLVRLNEEAKKLSGGSPGIGITLPRLAYEFVGLSYRAEDKMQTTRKIRNPKDGTSSSAAMFNPVPYTVAMDLSIYTKNIDDMLQIVEQILPYFGPHLGLTILEVPEMGLKNDISIQLDGLDTGIDYEGNIGDGRILQWTLQFSIMTRLFHPTADIGVIKKVIDNIHASHADEERIDSIITQVVNPITANENDVYTIEYNKQEEGLPSGIFTNAFTPPFA